MSDLVELSAEQVEAVYADLAVLGLLESGDRERMSTYRIWRHGSGRGGPGKRELSITTSIDRYDLETAHEFWFGVTRWAHVTVSVLGQAKLRLDDQRRIGRVREPGERSPVPLPDWYELGHLVYEHDMMLGLDRRRAIYQFFPPVGSPYLNISEALHLRQPR